MSQHYQDMKKSWPSLLISISDENAGKKSKNEPSTQTCLTPKAKIFGLGGVSSTPPRVANFNPCTRRRSFARISTKAFWLESFEVLEIMVEESDLGVSVVKVMVCLKENRIKKQIHFEFNFAKDSCTRIAIELVEEFKEDRQSFAKYPKHAEYVAKKLSEALENKKKMYINHKNLECKIDLEDILIRAGFTLDRENILQGLLKEGLTASDLIDGSLSEEELRYFVPKLGPRKRLCKLLRSEKRDLVESKMGRTHSTSLPSLPSQRSLVQDSPKRQRAKTVPEVKMSTKGPSKCLPRLLTSPPPRCMSSKKPKSPHRNT